MELGDSLNSICLAKEYGFQIKKEPECGDHWYSNEVIRQNCVKCDEKEKKLKDAELFRQQIEESHLKETNELRNENDHLAKENRKLIAQINCYRKGEFEVDSLIAHKISKAGKQQFLVRWKDFDSSEDKWVKREELKCPKILKKSTCKKYLCAHNLK